MLGRRRLSTYQRTAASHGAGGPAISRLLRIRETKGRLPRRPGGDDQWPACCPRLTSSMRSSASDLARGQPRRRRPCSPAPTRRTSGAPGRATQATETIALSPSNISTGIYGFPPERGRGYLPSRSSAQARWRRPPASSKVSFVCFGGEEITGCTGIG
ncbi:hypothetical protein ACU4GD_38665 [Cupriavidus basilensis]